MRSRLPLVLISQVQRSGGTLLSQLFDGHPQCAVYPHELKIGRPAKWDWPALALDAAPAEWFRHLGSPSLARMAASGYRKAGSNRYARERVWPFSFSVERFERRFLERCHGRVTTQRDILDAYMDAFFETWTDYASSSRERFVVAFTPRVQMTPASLARLGRDYPDGRLMTIVRDPVRWYVSASRHDPDEYGNLERAIEIWRASASASLHLAMTQPGRVRLVLYEALAGATRDTMSAVARFLGIDWDDCLQTPSYCGQPTLPNSSFDIAATGVSDEPLRRALALPPQVVERLDAALQPLYAEAVAVAAAAARTPVRA
jgi:hypothetical protein